MKTDKNLNELFAAIYGEIANGRYTITKAGGLKTEYGTLRENDWGNVVLTQDRKTVCDLNLRGELAAAFYSALEKNVLVKKMSKAIHSLPNPQAAIDRCLSEVPAITEVTATETPAQEAAREATALEGDAEALEKVGDHDGAATIRKEAAAIRLQIARDERDAQNRADLELFARSYNAWAPERLAAADRKVKELEGKVAALKAALAAVADSSENPNKVAKIAAKAIGI